MSPRKPPLLGTLAGTLLLAACSNAVTPADTQGASGARRLLQTPVDPATLDKRAYCKGEARSPAGDWWAFSTAFGQTPAGAVAGTFLMANSLTNKTYFGTISSGAITLNPGGGGLADMTGTLTTGASITLRFTDANSASAWDTFFFQTGATSFTGEVRHGVIRLLRARPLAGGTANQTGFTFDSRMGLFIYAADLTAERLPAPEPLPVDVLEVTPPNPVIDFRADQPGGYTMEPGGINNTPPP